MTVLMTIFQVKDEHTREHGFMGLDMLRKVADNPRQSEVIDMRRYEAVFNERDISGAVYFGFPKPGKELELLETIYKYSNNPGDTDTFRDYFGFRGRSISVGDIVRLRFPYEGIDSYYYCDSFGWVETKVKEVPNWIDVGMHASGSYASDVYPFEVIKVPHSGKVITIRGLDSENAPDYAYYSNQAHTFKSNPDNSTYTVRQHKNGEWKTPDGMTIWFGNARKYQDPHF